MTWPPLGMFSTQARARQPATGRPARCPCRKLGSGFLRPRARCTTWFANYSMHSPPKGKPCLVCDVAPVHRRTRHASPRTRAEPPPASNKAKPGRRPHARTSASPRSTPKIAAGVPNVQTEIYQSENGDRWFLCRDGDVRVYIKHEANLASGGAVTAIELRDFLRPGRAGPEHQALVRLIGSLIEKP
jgi:hypothetical protein